MIAYVQITLTLSVACVCVCRAEEHWAVVMGIKQQVDHLERKSNDGIDSVESIPTGGERGRRSLSQSDRTDSLTMMNNLRRTVGSSNMPYLSYDVERESDAASWTFSCNYDRPFDAPGSANNYYWVKYITPDSMTIADVINELYKSLPKGMSSVYLTSFGCDLRQCRPVTSEGIRYQYAQLTMCVFNSDSEFDKTKYQYELGEGCTECNSGSYWCDYGLCRDDCAASDSNCYCNSYCLNCAATDSITCSCQCLNGWIGSRCETANGVNTTTPTCSTTPRIPTTSTTTSTTGKSTVTSTTASTTSKSTVTSTTASTTSKSTVTSTTASTTSKSTVTSTTASTTSKSTVTSTTASTTSKSTVALTTPSTTGESIGAATGSSKSGSSIGKSMFRVAFYAAVALLSKICTVLI